ncbi:MULTISPECIES: GntR family transcriptional regulator [unclassified Enterococcus]|uniref:GntR family transcriptional regulator n=2 Tax=Enterococcus TaxID=1350 RepID=UPI000A34B685|nr:GntR family transcriptional regulator [Enterococcus casseliflavus]
MYGQLLKDGVKMANKYEQLADILREKIRLGTYQEGDAIPSEATLQEEFHYSRHTVRQAIAVLVNEGYLRKERGSGTYVSKPETVNHKNRKTIGIIMTYLSDYIFPSIMRGVEQTLREQGYSLLLGSTNNDHEQERACLQQMMDQGVDGLIVEPTKSSQYNPNLAYYVALQEAGIPLVMINAYYEELDLPHICVNDTRSGFLATNYLLEQQHQQLMMITKIDDLQGKYRMKGFVKALTQAKRTFAAEDVLTYTTETKEAVIEQAIQRLTAADNQVTGIVCYNDEIAHRLIQALTAAGRNVPTDFSIVGNDDSPLSTLSTPTITTLTHPKEAMGELAAQWITTGKATEAQRFYFEPELIVRGSVNNQKGE